MIILSNKYIGFSADENYQKKVDYLKKHLSQHSVAKINLSDVLKYAVDRLYVEYESK